MNSGLTVEVVLFKLNPGTDEAVFLAGAGALMDDLRRQPGYLRRELLKGDDGTWVDIVHWRSRADAFAAAETIMSWPSGQSFGAMIDPNSITMLHPTQALVFAE